MATVSVLPLACANWIPGATICPAEGRSACKNCKLVVYCGPTCQKSHWPEHKKICKSPLSKESWRPQWDQERREPAWASGAAAQNWHNPYGGDKHLWGNVSAIDVLRMKQNEGDGYKQRLGLLFAASGDLRNVVKTLADLTTHFSNTIQISINDREFEVVARNAIILFLALTVQDTKTAPDPTEDAESLIHLWYSAFLYPELMSELHARVKPLVDNVCNRIAQKSANAVLGKTWTFTSGNTLRLVLRREDWFILQTYLDVPNGLTKEDAGVIRAAVTLAPERADYRDRWYFKDQDPFMRIAKRRFQEDGLLLPFGHPRVGFNFPNPTFFHTSKKWSMDDKADPLTGWPLWEVSRTPFIASHDAYGKLLIFLREVVQKFLRRLATGNTNFELYNMDVRELPQHLSSGMYDRIETSNICDAGYVGTRDTLTILSPLLRSPRDNPHASMITLYLNAVMEMVKMDGSQNELPNMDTALNYLPRPRIESLLSMNGADIYRLWDARSLFLDVKKFFERYMTVQQFDRIPDSVGIIIKENTVTEPWPTQLKLRPGQQGAQEEFDGLLGSDLTGMEHYVEWKRIV